MLIVHCLTASATIPAGLSGFSGLVTAVEGIFVKPAHRMTCPLGFVTVLLMANPTMRQTIQFTFHQMIRQLVKCPFVHPTLWLVGCIQHCNYKKKTNGWSQGYKSNSYGLQGKIVICQRSLVALKRKGKKLHHIFRSKSERKCILIDYKYGLHFN